MTLCKLFSSQLEKSGSSCKFSLFPSPFQWSSAPQWPEKGKACLHLMVGGFIPEGAPDGSASRLPEALEEPALACPAPEEEAPASEAAPEGQGVGSGLRGRA